MTQTAKKPHLALVAGESERRPLDDAAAPAAKPGKRPTKRKPDNLFLRGGVWWIRYNVAGKKIRKSLHTTSEREAKRLRDQILGKRSRAAIKFGLGEQQPAEPCKGFADICKLWLKARDADTTLAPKTRYLAKHVVNKYLLPALGRKLMSAITVEDIEQLIASMRSKGLSRKTVSDYYRWLATIFRQAIRRGWYLGPNPLDRVVRPPRPGIGRQTALSEKQATHFLTCLDKVLSNRPGKTRTGRRLFYKCVVALKTGLRWGEVHGIAWDDLDLDATPPVLRLKRSFQGTLKTDESAEPLPLSEEVVELLRRWQKEQVKPSPWVFPTISGKPMHRRSDVEDRLIREAAELATLTEAITPHVFRHTFGTWVYETSQDVKRTQRLLRHSCIESTMRYVHDRRELGSVVDALPRLTTPRHLKAV